MPGDGEAQGKDTPPGPRAARSARRKHNKLVSTRRRAIQDASDPDWAVQRVAQRQAQQEEEAAKVRKRRSARREFYGAPDRRNPPGDTGARSSNDTGARSSNEPKGKGKGKGRGKGRIGDDIAYSHWS